jgi:hypothetical protein
MNDNALQHLAAIVRDPDDAITGKPWMGLALVGMGALNASETTLSNGLVPPDREDELPNIL